jgi:hypothetical protein
MTYPTDPTQDDVARETEETLEAAQRTLEQAQRTARAAARGGEEMLTTAATEHPIAAVAAALALGFLFGRAL